MEHASRHALDRTARREPPPAPRRPLKEGAPPLPAERRPSYSRGSMRSHPLLRALVALALIAAPGTAQRALAAEHEAARAALPPLAPAWFELGLEQIEAELECDARRAREHATELARRAGEAQNPFFAAVAEELAALATTMAEGPARVTRERVALPAEAGPLLRAELHLARARRLSLADQPTDVLADTLASLDAARLAARPAPILRAAWFLHDITEDEALDLDSAVLSEIEAHAHTRAAAAFEALRHMTEYWRSWASLSMEGRHAAIDSAQAAAEALGDVRGLIQVEWDRAVLWSEVHDVPRAVEFLERARGLAAEAGFLREEAVSLQILAEFALASGDLELARASLTESADLVRGTGLVDPEIRQEHLALRLASASADQAGVIAASARLEELRRSSDARREEYAAVRQQLFAAELARVGLEHDMKAARAHTRRLAAGATVVALLLLALLATFGRRRLAQTNRRLREEMLRAEGEARARVELEQRMRRLERSESLGLIASGVAHDFSNLMAGVLGSAELLRLRVQDPGLTRHLDAIGDAVERGTRLCRQLQAYSGGEPAAFERLDLAALLRALAPALEAAAGAGITLAVEPAEGDLGSDADRSQLEQALLNLVANARDARAHRVTVRARRERREPGDWQAEFHRGETRAGEFLCLEVEDDGEGLSPELLERIFDPFFTTRFPGRGLGLAVVLGAVRRHHGAVSVASRPGQGSRFRLYLPVLASGTAREILVPPPAARPRSAPRAPLEVLVVDDESQVCAYVRAILEAHGHRVVTTEDGAAAARLAGSLGGPRRVALVDLTMPVTDGRDVVRSLRARADAPAIVLMSGHATAHLRETARELAVEGYLAKPFLSDALEEALQAALETRAERRSERAPLAQV